LKPEFKLELKLLPLEPGSGGELLNPLLWLLKPPQEPFAQLPDEKLGCPHEPPEHPPDEKPPDEKLGWPHEPPEHPPDEKPPDEKLG